MDRKTLIEILGPFPTKVDLNPTILESTGYDDYIQEKVEYNVEPNERVKAYILIPKDLKGKRAVAFCHHQHASDYNLGKSQVVGLAGDPNQAYAKELAERGYITFAPDAIAFEERNWHSNKESWWGVEYFELATRLIRGQTLLAKVLHDISVGIDYLISRPEVNKQKIGFIGHSYGARMAMTTPVFDRRVKAAVANCYFVSYRSNLDKEKEVRIPMEFCVPNILQHGDIGDIVRLIEPCSLYLSAAADDKWSQDAKEIYDYAKPAFKQGELKLKIWPTRHAFTKEMRQEAYAFLDKHLLN